MEMSMCMPSFRARELPAFLGIRESRSTDRSFSFGPSVCSPVGLDWPNGVGGFPL